MALGADSGTPTISQRNNFNINSPTNWPTALPRRGTSGPKSFALIAIATLLLFIDAYGSR
jgi:hypothetical protein